jgi:hypothetical protein
MKVERPPRRFCLSYAVLNLSTSSFIVLHETGSHIYVRTPYVKFYGNHILNLNSSTTSCKVGYLPSIKSLILKLSRWTNSILKIWIWTVFTPQFQNFQHDEAIWLSIVRPKLKILCCIQNLLVAPKTIYMELHNKMTTMVGCYRAAIHYSIIPGALCNGGQVSHK